MSPRPSWVGSMSVSEKAHALRGFMPSGGLFDGKTWRISPEPMRLSKTIWKMIEDLGSRLHAFQKACNLLYRQSVEGKQPSWIHQYLDAGKPSSLLQFSREKKWKNDLPAVIRPDLLVAQESLVLTELDSVPGGIGLTAWMQMAYGGVREQGRGDPPSSHQGQDYGAAGRGQKGEMIEGFLSIFNSDAQNIAIVISKEAGGYRPEMEWLAKEASSLEPRAPASPTLLRRSASQRRELPSGGGSSLQVCSPEDLEYRPEGVFLNNQKLDSIYRFFELFDLPNIAHIEKLMAAALEGKARVTPPFKPQLEEKLWLGLFWFPQLADFWRRELGERYFHDLQKIIPFTWVLDPAPLPPHAAIPHLNIHDWEQLGNFSQKQRDLILKISGFSERAWGSRGVRLGSDMSSDAWREAVQRALEEFESHPHVLQRFAHSSLMEGAWYDFERDALVPMKGRLRLCPYYFVEKEVPVLRGVLATLCPSDKKIVHGMEDAIMTLALPLDP